MKFEKCLLVKKIWNRFLPNVYKVVLSLKNNFWECFPPNVLGSFHSRSTCTTYVGLILHCNLGKIIIDNIIYYIVYFFLFLLISLQLLFSSPDMKAHLSFSYHVLSGVRLCVNFFSRTTRPLSTKRITKHHWVKDIQVVKYEGPCSLKRGENKKNIWIFLVFFKTLLHKNQLTRKDEICVDISSDSSLLKSWSPRVGLGHNGGRLYTHKYTE